MDPGYAATIVVSDWKDSMNTKKEVKKSPKESWLTFSEQHSTPG